MKTFLITITLCLITSVLQAQKPEPILSFATQLKPVSWYAEQRNLWKSEIDKNRSNGLAWYNYYRSTRNLLRLDTTDKRPHKEKVEQMRSLINEMAAAVPNSFEYHACKWMFEGNNFAYLDHLKKAEELGKDRTEHLSDMIVWGEVERDITKRDKYCKQWLDKAPYSPGLMYYNYNVLAGLKPNAILLTCGDNDSYPVWMLQQKGFRRDVTVMNASLVRIDSYREKLFKELGIPKWEADTSNQERFEKELIKHMANNSKKAPVYVALTCGETYTKPIAENLYLTGLAYEYSKESIDNIAILKKNMEQVYALDYIDKPFFYDISEHYTRLTNGNYVVPMVKLYDHYKLSGEEHKAEDMKNRILQIVKGRPEEAETRKYFK